jgi:hypothetical protein
MDLFKAVAFGALGFAACLALLLVAGRLYVRWHRAVISAVALMGLLLQGALWGGITCTLKRFEVGGSYFWLYAALVTSVIGTVWALCLLGSTMLSRRFTD